MKNVFKVYNNEAFVCCVITSILSVERKMDISRLFLLTAILLNDKLVKDTDNLLRYDSIKNYLNGNLRQFVTFPDMFDELIPIILNSLTISAESYYISISEQDIVLRDNRLFNVKSNRLNQINMILKHVIDISREIPTKELYNVLKVRI